MELIDVGVKYLHVSRCHYSLEQFDFEIVWRREEQGLCIYQRCAVACHNVPNVSGQLSREVTQALPPFKLFGLSWNSAAEIIV